MKQQEKGALVWLAVVACALFGFVGFAIAAPWTFSVYSVADAAVQCPGAIDPSWPAVECNHGKPGPWARGLIADHPIRYAAAVLQMIVGWGAFFYGTVFMKRFR